MSHQVNLMKLILFVSVTVSFYILMTLSPQQDWPVDDEFDQEKVLDNQTFFQIKEKRSHNTTETIDLLNKIKQVKKLFLAKSSIINQIILTHDKLVILNRDSKQKQESNQKKIDEIKRIDTNSCSINLAMIFIDVNHNSYHSNTHFRMNEKLTTALTSILKYSHSTSSTSEATGNITYCVHLIIDYNTQYRAQTVIAKLKHLMPKKNDFKLIFNLHHVDAVTQPLEHLMPSLQSHFSYKPGSYYSHSLFFLSLILHRVENFHQIDKLIYLDIDVQLNGPIEQLYDYFNHFLQDNVMGIAFEQQPVYLHLLNEYRQQVGEITRNGGPPPDGLPGFNSGVLLLDLAKMRQSKLYNSLLNPQQIDLLTKKYHFKGHLGDQDFYSLISFDYEELFYVLPCQWNRQLCQWWRYHGYSHVFDDYYQCNSSIKLYHGNCNSVIPSNLL